MALDSVLGAVSYYGSFAWIYGIQTDLWEAAVDSYKKNFDQLEKPHLITLIDYRVERSRARLWTLNFFAPMPTLLCSTLVAHGSGSGYPACARVGRERGSNMSTVGGFKTAHIYQSKLGQKDKTKKRPAMVLIGLDRSNSNARSRGIRMHGAHYVSDSVAKCSHGCICCKQDIHENLIKIIEGGSFMFSYFGDKNVKL